jgi:hypothetical protein
MCRQSKTNWGVGWKLFKTNERISQAVLKIVRKIREQDFEHDDKSFDLDAKTN